MTQDLSVEFRAIYPRVVAVVGDEQVAKWLEFYEQAFGRRDWDRLESLRAFPLFLRNENRLHRLNQPWLVDLALWEWTEFSVLYSPMDEDAERASLKPGELLLNPTTQIVRLESDLIAWMDDGRGAIPPSEKIMVFLYRRRGEAGRFEVSHMRGEWTSAALLDVLLENGRISEELLWKEIREHHGQGGERDWKSVIAELESAGILLRS